MKKLFLLFAALLLILTGCSSTEPEILFDEASEGLVSVILKDYNDGTIHYDTIGSDGQRQPTQPFESDPVEILTASSSCFESSTDDSHVKNRLVKAELLDGSGEPVEIDETLRRIFALAAEQEHEILKMQILRTENHHFVTIEWNVNFWDPHVVLFYDPAADQLIELFTYDATHVIGLKILNL